LDDRATSGALYSRALLGDLCPDALSPLTATAGVGAELDAAWWQVYREAGFDPGAAHGTAAARFGGYLYLDTSLLRMLGSAVGADPLAFSRQFLPERPDVPRARERVPAPDGARLGEWLSGVLGAGKDADPGLLDEPAGGCPVARDPAGAAGLTDAALVAAIRRVRTPLGAALRRWVRAELGLAVGAELLDRLTEQAGHPACAGALLAGAHPRPDPAHQRLWALAAALDRSVTLTRLFDRGVTAVAGVLEPEQGGDPGRLRACLGDLIRRHPHRGPAEWELNSPTWETEWRLPLGLIDVLRRVTGDRPDPAARAAEQAACGARRARQVRAALGGSADRERFEAALAAARYWSAERADARDAVSVLHHRQRRAARELGRRYLETGLLDDGCQLFMLREDELDALLGDPEDTAAQARLRGYDSYAAARYQPPFTSLGAPGPLVGWPRRGGQGGGRVTVRGTVAAEGRAAGRVRIPGSAADTRGMRGGEVLVVPGGGPSWVPLLPAVNAVVVDGGGPLSELAVACRDLGVPCVVGAVDASTRLSGGQEVTVAGGVVSVVR
jgi:rifampicin phosphotransferase